MPKMRILSGAQAGSVVEMPLPEAQNAYCTGYAELYIEPERPEAKPSREPKAEDTIKHQPDPSSQKPEKPKGRKGA